MFILVEEHTESFFVGILIFFWSNFKNYFLRKLIIFFKEVWLSTWGKYEKSKMLYEWEQLCSFFQSWSF